MAITAVCFDVGGVLIRITYRWSEVLGRLGLAAPPHISPDALLTDYEPFNRYQDGALTDDEYLSELARYLSVDASAALDVHNAILVEPYAEVDRLVLGLQSEGILTGCLSNTNEPHWHAMLTSGRFPANEALEVRLASHLLGLQKPEEATYREFERESGRAAGEILLFDDTDLNCQAARRYSWDAVRIDPAGDPSAQMCEALLARGVDVRSQLNRLPT